MDLLDEYKDMMAEDFVGAEILGKKVKVKIEGSSLLIYDEEDLLANYKYEYILFAIIMNDGDGYADLYDGKLTKTAERLYSVDTTQPDPRRMPKFEIPTLTFPTFPDFSNSPINIPSQWELPDPNRPPVTWITTSNVSTGDPYTVVGSGIMGIANEDANPGAHLTLTAVEPGAPNLNVNIQRLDTNRLFTIDTDGRVVLAGTGDDSDGHTE